MKKLKVSEIIGFSICALFLISGLGLMITGLIGTYSGPSASNPVKIAEAQFVNFTGINLNFRQWGAIILIVGALIAMFILLKHAKKHDLQIEKAQRRAQRLGL